MKLIHFNIYNSHYLTADSNRGKLTLFLTNIELLKAQIVLFELRLAVLLRKMDTSFHCRCFIVVYLFLHVVSGMSHKRGPKGICEQYV